MASPARFPKRWNTVPFATPARAAMSSTFTPSKPVLVDQLGGRLENPEAVAAGVSSLRPAGYAGQLARVGHVHSLSPWLLT